VGEDLPVEVLRQLVEQFGKELQEGAG